MRVVVLVSFIFFVLNAAPAREATHTFTQSDGDTFVAKQKGDEYLHWVETSKGDILIYNKKTDNYDYVTIEKDELIPSSVSYRKDVRKVRAINRADILKLWKKKREQHH